MKKIVSTVSVVPDVLEQVGASPPSKAQKYPSGLKKYQKQIGMLSLQRIVQLHCSLNDVLVHHRPPRHNNTFLVRNKYQKWMLSQRLFQLHLCTGTSWIQMLSSQRLHCHSTDVLARHRPPRHNNTL